MIDSRPSSSCSSGSVWSSVEVILSPTEGDNELETEPEGGVNTTPTTGADVTTLPTTPVTSKGKLI